MRGIFWPNAGGRLVGSLQADQSVSFQLMTQKLRQMIAIVSFARAQRLDLRNSIPYNRFKDTVADKLGEYLKTLGLVRQKPHPFPLHKKWEAAGKETEESLFRALATLADLEVKRKSGGVPVDLSLEMFLLSRVK